MKKRCFIAGRKDTLFKNLVASLLNGRIDDMDVQESQADDFDGLLVEISEADPTLIMLDDSYPFSKDSFLVQILLHRPDLPVIVISEDSNLMHIVRKETKIIDSSKDLFNVVNILSGTEFVR